MYLLFCFGLVSCEKDANVKLPQVPSKLVAIAYISPQDSLVKVYVSLSQPLFDNKNAKKLEPLEGANVTISSLFGTYNLSYNANLETYVADSTVLKIRAGVTYNLLVSTGDGKQITGSTLIPYQNTSLGLTYIKDTEAEELYTIKATWQDPPGENNYYRLFVEKSSYYIYSGNTQQGVGFSDTIKTRYVQDELLDDLKNPGGVLTNLSSLSAKTTPGITDHFYLLHVSKEYYDYHQKLYVSGVSGNPFAEPAQMYTNITGGYGIFAGYNSYKVKMEP